MSLQKLTTRCRNPETTFSCFIHHCSKVTWNHSLAYQKTMEIHLLVQKNYGPWTYSLILDKPGTSTTCALGQETTKLHAIFSNFKISSSYPSPQSPLLMASFIRPELESWFTQSTSFPLNPSSTLLASRGFCPVTNSRSTTPNP